MAPLSFYNQDNSDGSFDVRSGNPPPDPTSGLNRMLFSKSGVNGQIFESPLNQYSSTLYESGGLTNYPVHDIRVDSINRWVVISANNFPNILQTPLDNPNGFSYGGGSGTWEQGLDIDEVNGHKYTTDTFEVIWVGDYNNTGVNSYHLFVAREGRPVKVKVDIEVGILVVQVVSETSRLLTFPISNTEDNETEIESSTGTHVFDVDLQRHVLYYRDINDQTAIRVSNYDATGNTIFYQHNEVIHWMQYTRGNSNYLYFTTDTGLYALNLDFKISTKIFDTPNDIISRFDFEYEV